MPRRPSMASLRLFLHVARTLSFSETARGANLSQPALSRTIKLLEEELGVRLFDRDSRNVRLTDAGMTLVPAVERLIQDYDFAFVELDKTFRGARGRVVVGALPSVAAAILPGVIARFQAARPHVEIVVRENVTGGLDQSLHDRLVDFAISTRPATDADIDFVPLFEDECVLVGRATDLDRLPDPAPWSVFDVLPFIGMEAQSSVRRLTDLAFSRVGLSPPVLYQCSQVPTLGALISQGLGISLLPRSALILFGRGEPIVARTILPPICTRTIGICQLASRTLSPVAQALREAVVREGTAIAVDR